MKNTIILFTLFILCIGCQSCQKDTRTFSTLFVHTAFGAPAVDYKLSGQTTISNINYGSQTAYRSVTASLNDIISVFAIDHGSGQTLALNQQPLWEDGKKFSVFLYKTDTAYNIAYITDSFSTPASGHSSVRFIHLGSDAPAVDILLNGTEIFDNKVFYDLDHLNSFTPFNDIAAGIYTLQVRKHGTTNIIYTEPNFILADGITYTLYATGILNAAAAPTFKVGVEVNN